MENHENEVIPTQSRVTPLWIVAAFVTLTETVLGFAVTQVTGGVQIALTCFVIIFALLVAGAFFFILWNRPYVFYSPAEYAGADPKHFVQAMKGIVPDQIVERVRAAEAKPTDDIAQFALMDSFLDDVMRQHLIMMKEKNVGIPFKNYAGINYETGRAGGSWSSGGISGREIAKRLGGSGLVSVTPDGESVSLTPLGGRFSDWLVANGKRNDYYSSELGGWGEVKRPAGLPKGFFTGAPQVTNPVSVASPPPSTPTATAGSIADAFGAAPSLRSGADIIAQRRAERDEWGER
jgi:hypothetical protein